MKRIFTIPLFLLVPAIANTGCDEDFTPYNEVTDFRVLALGSDKPALLPDEIASVSALVTGSTDVSYAWSWCPFSGPATEGYPCIIPHADIQTFADEILSEPVTVPPYALGTGATAEFPHNIPPKFYSAICQFIIGQNIPDGFTPPDCSSGFEIQVKLEATGNGKTITAVTELNLLLDPDAVPNQNPVLNGLSFNEVGASPQELLDGSSVKRETKYELLLDIAETEAETFQELQADGEILEAQETLVASWFYTSGALDKSRSSFLPGSVAVEQLRENAWTPPTQKDNSETSAKLFIVVRDGRFGTTWLTRDIELVTP